MKNTTPEPKTVRVSAIVEQSLADEVAHYVENHSVNKSALVRRGLRLALDELSAQYAKPKGRKAST